jgi:hypothetical protein
MNTQEIPLTENDFDELLEDPMGVAIGSTVSPIHLSWFHNLPISDNNSWFNGLIIATAGAERVNQQLFEGQEERHDPYAYSDALVEFYSRIQHGPDDRDVNIQNPEIPKHCQDCFQYYSFKGTLPIKILITGNNVFMADGIFNQGDTAYICTECFFKMGGRADQDLKLTLAGCTWFQIICFYRFAPPWHD